MAGLIISFIYQLGEAALYIRTMGNSFDEKRGVANSSTPEKNIEASPVTARDGGDTPHLTQKVEGDNHLKTQHSHQQGEIHRHQEGDHTAAAILAHPDGHDANSSGRSSLNTDRDPEKGDTSPSTLHGIPSSPAQSTRALTIIPDENVYPEGGLQAWLVVFGCWCSLLAALGVMNTLGAFQANVHRNQLKDYTEGQIGWIFSVYSALSFGLGVFVGPIFDKYGARALMITGSVAIVVGMMLLSVCTRKFTSFYCRVLLRSLHAADSIFSGTSFFGSHFSVSEVTSRPCRSSARPPLLGSRTSSRSWHAY